MNMWELIYTFTTWVARIHERVLRINDAGGWYFDDKQLHFIVFGIFGMALIFVLYPLFKMLAKHDHTMVITWLYVFTVIMVLAFAIEIGQWYTGTGVMESQDIAYGITGFLVMFLIFAILRGLYHGVRAMVRNAKNYKNVEISHMFSLGPGDYCKEEYKDNFHPNMWFISGQTRKACNYWGDYTTFFFHELPELMRQGRVKVDVVLIQVSKPDKLGYVSLGVSGDYTVQAVRSAKTVIAQVNEHMPFSYGDVVFPLMEYADAIVEYDEYLPTIPASKIGPVEEEIGKYCASLIEDGATLQLGIGSLPNVIGAEIAKSDLKDLGMHTELGGDAYYANVDTTFALYRDARFYHRGPAIRMAGPYTFRHLPWYYDSDHLPEDESYYLAHANDSSSTKAWMEKKVAE